MRVDGPIFFLLERFDLAFALHDQSKGDGLHPSGRKSTANFIPQQRRNLVADQPVEHAPRLLRVYQILVNGAGMFESRLHRPLGDFVERDPLNARRDVRIFFLLLFLLRGAAIACKFSRKVCCNSLAFTVRVRRQIDRIHRGRQLLQLGQNLFFSRDDDVVSLEVVAGIHPQSALGQIFHVAERGLDSKSLSQIFLDGFRLSRRFDND